MRLGQFLGSFNLFSAPDHVAEGARSYAQQLASDMQAVGVTPPASLSAPDVKWQDIFAAEELFISSLTKPEQLPHLIRRAVDVYDRYEDLIPEARRKGYERVKDVLITDAGTVDTLRADLLRIHAITAREHLLNREIEGERSRLSSVVALTGMTAIAGVALFILGGKGTGWAGVSRIAFIVLALITTLRWIIGIRQYATTGELSKSEPPKAAMMILLVLLGAGSVQAQTQSATTTDTTATDTTATTPAASQPAQQLPSPQPVVPPKTEQVPETCDCDDEMRRREKIREMEAEQAEENERAVAEKRAPKALPKPTDKEREPICPDPGPTLIAAALMGVLGATFSILQRLQRPTRDHDPVAVLLTFRSAWTQLPLSLLSGAIAAMILYGIFAAKMVTGTLFPSIVNCCRPMIEGGPFPLVHFFDFTGPEDMGAMGRLLVWSVVAGFSERFVPDILDSFKK